MTPLGESYTRTSRPALGAPALEGKIRVDVAVVGAGFTGASTALHLAEAGASVVLLEAKEVGAGGSGRPGEIDPRARRAGEEEPRKTDVRFSEPGATSHVAAELFMGQTGTELVHVPYKGGGPAIAALLGGEISMLFNDVPSFESHISGNRVRALGVTTLTRLQTMPALPTVAESGVPGFEVTTTNAISVPKGVPARSWSAFVERSWRY